MNRRTLLHLAAVALLSPLMARADDPVIYGPEKIDSPPMALLAGKIITVTGEAIANGVVLVKDSKIVAVGRQDEVTIPPGYKVIAKPDALLYPGFMEIHSHVGGKTALLPLDLNDCVQQINNGLRTYDFYSTYHNAAKKARAAGVTSLLYIPGSGSNMTGWGTLIKTWGRTAREALIRFPGVLKMAQAGNPERSYTELGTGRMGMNALLRNFFQKGKDYADAWADYNKGLTKVKPAYDASWELFIPLFKHEFPVCVHTQNYQPVLASMRMWGDEFGLKYFPSHSTRDAFKLGKEIRKRADKDNNVFINCGPRKVMLDRETGRMVGIDFEWWKNLGDDLHSMNTDAPVLPQEELTTQCAMACRLGLPPHVAIRGLTINNARWMGVQNKLGSIEKGKDADLVFWSGDPIDPRSHVEMTVISGHIAYDPARDGRIY